MKKTIMSNQPQDWYAVTTKGLSGRKVRAILDELNVQHFLPLIETEVEHYGMKEKTFKPLVLNLVFICADYSTIQSLIDDHHIPMTFMLDSVTQCPLSYSNKKIQDIKYLLQYPDEILRLTNDNLKPGEHVRVLDGEFAGIEGELIRIKGHKRVVVRLDGLFSLATAYVPVAYLEKLDH